MELVFDVLGTGAPKKREKAKAIRADAVQALAIAEEELRETRERALEDCSARPAFERSWNRYRAARSLLARLILELRAALPSNP